MSKTITVDRAKVLEVYNSVPSAAAAAIKMIFGKALIPSPHCYEGFEDICLAVGHQSSDASFGAGTIPDDEVAYRQIKLFTQVLNMDEDGKPWIPDWNNPREEKWEIVWKMDSPGFRLYDIVIGYGITFTVAGSRLCFRNRAIAKYASETFIEYYRRFLA